MKVFFTNFNNVLSDLKNKIIDIGWKGVDFMEADKVILWNEVGDDAIMLINLVYKYNKSVITIQHGRYGTSRYYPPFNQQILSDKLCVWGIRDKKALVEAGHPANKIEVVGTTIFNYLKPRKKHKGINVVYSPEHWANEIEENRQVAEELRKLKDVKIITKLLEGEHNVEWYDNPVISDRKKDGHLKVCADVLSKADLVVGISEGTFELMAQYLDIPVVIMNEWNPKPLLNDERYLKYRRVTSEASKKSTLKNLCKVVKQQLKNPDELKKERKIVVREEGGADIKDTVDRIIKIIKNA